MTVPEMGTFKLSGLTEEEIDETCYYFALAPVHRGELMGTFGFP